MALLLVTITRVNFGVTEDVNDRTARDAAFVFARLRLRDRRVNVWPEVVSAGVVLDAHDENYKGHDE